MCDRFNLWGSSDVRALTSVFVEWMLSSIGFGLAAGVKPHLERGYFNRLDATYNFDLGDPSSASSLVRQLGTFATIKHRRSSTWAGSMTFPGRAASLSIYHKGPEMRAHPVKVEAEGLLDYADRVVRFEVVSRSERLDIFDLRKFSRWQEGCCTENLFRLWLSFVSKMRFPIMTRLDLDKLTRPQRRLYGVWLAGHDVHDCASRATVYRHRAAILEAGGPDIALAKPSGEVIEFRKVLTPRPALVPEQFRVLLFDPRRAA